MDGRSYRGAHSNAGEWGHTTLVYDGDECRCGARGCLEAYIGSDTVNRRLAAALGRDVDPGLLTRLLAGPIDVPAAAVIEQTVAMGRLTNPAIRCAGVSLNTAALGDAEAANEIERTAARLGLPVADPIRGGAAFDGLLDACAR